MTLAKFSAAYDHAFDFLDHFPGSNGDTNPKTDGPYKGWIFYTPPPSWPAGGDAQFPNTLAARYHYDSGTGNVTIQWEVRPANGVDGSAGGWDQSVTLSSSDAIAPGGGYGIYKTYYGAVDQLDGGMAIANFSMTCVNP